MFQQRGQQMDDKAFNKFISQVDSNGDGVIDFQEFQTLMTNLVYHKSMIGVEEKWEEGAIGQNLGKKIAEKLVEKTFNISIIWEF